MPPITKDEIKEAIRKMKLHKAPGIDSISAEVLRTEGKPLVEMLHKIFNQIWKSERTPKDWTRMLVTPIYKKGDHPGNYRAISLLSIPFSIICAEPNEIKDRGSHRREPVDAIFIVRQVIEKTKEHRVPLHFNFVDFKAAFDTVWRKAL